MASTSPDTESIETFLTQLSLVHESISTRAINLSSLPVNSTPSIISHSLSVLPSSLPEVGLGLKTTTELLLKELYPALSPGHSGPRYFGFVTGGSTPIAQLSDILVGSFDNSLQIHLPNESISTTIEDQSLSMLLSLLSLPSSRFTSNTYTTGATASNILALTIAREYITIFIKEKQGFPNYSVAESGMGGIEIDIFSAGAHNSISKSAAILGIGRSNVHEILRKEDELEMCAFDLIELEKRLKMNVELGRGSIVISSFGEVNTGGFTPDTIELRRLCDGYNAWFHIDAAFGAFACLHPDFTHISSEMSLADSITSDAHKWLNVPYDCGILFSRSNYLLEVCGPGSTLAPYLLSSATTTTSSNSTERNIPNPLFKNLENSRRFRALPVYSTLLNYGKSGITQLISKNIQFCRSLEEFIRFTPEGKGYEILTPLTSLSHPNDFKTLNILLFTSSSSAPMKYQGDKGVDLLKEKINESREIYVTGTTWRGRKGIRLAVSNWSTEEERDGQIVRRVLERVMRE